MAAVPATRSSPVPSRAATLGGEAPDHDVSRAHVVLGLASLVALGALLFGSAPSAAPSDPVPTPPTAAPPPAAPRPVALPPPPPVEEPSPPCRPEMVLVEGSYCTDVRQDCVRWLDDPALPFARCAQYSTKSRCVGKRVPMRFCIDRREYTPPGAELPQNWASFDVASKTCESLGKRICTDSEWNFACEGEAMLPYPYGYERKPVCNQDRTDLYEKNPHRQVLRDLREPADGRPECRSPFGVENLVGNMDEPVAREGFENNAPFRNALKGGWWMPARNRCRPATTAHDDHFTDIQIGVRCCEAAGPVPGVQSGGD